MESWLNDKTVDGFLGNLREPENFIVTDAKWNATEDDRGLGKITRPSDDGTIVEDAVGLLNVYEYQSSNNGGTNGYLNNGLQWWTLTPNDLKANVVYVQSNGVINDIIKTFITGVRPSINLKSNVKIVNGDGTIDDPYRLEGDNDTNLYGTLLKDRYSGEYIKFGTGENTLYRIVSHENGIGTKITSSQPLKDNGLFKRLAFDSNNNVNYSSTNTIGTFLNGEYLTNYVDSEYANMIEDTTTWYLGTVGYGMSYKLAKYTDTTGNTLTSSTTIAKVGLLRHGELMAGQFDREENNTSYWTLTPYSSESSLYVSDVSSGGGFDVKNMSIGIKLSINLKSNVVITSGDGTKNNPFTLELV